MTDETLLTISLDGRGDVVYSIEDDCERIAFGPDDDYDACLPLTMNYSELCTVLSRITDARRDYQLRALDRDGSLLGTTGPEMAQWFRDHVQATNCPEHIHLHLTDDFGGRHVTDP